MPSALLLPVLTCVVVLVVSGVAKLRAPDSVDAAFTALDVPSALDTPLVRRLFPWVEIALGVWLLLATGPALVVVALLVLALFLAYLVLVARAARRPEPVDCGCFGSLGDSEVTAVTVWRNAALVLSAALAVLAGIRGSALLPALVDDTGVWAWLAATALTVAIAVLATHRSATSTESDTDGAASGAWSVDENGDYVRTNAPLLTFLDEDGKLVSLENSVAEGAHLLLFLSPHCEPCLRVASLVPEWASRLSPVRVRAVVRGNPALLAGRDDLAMLRGHAWFDPYAIARRQLGAGSPGAVLIGIDGLLAGGPVSGERHVGEFVEAVLEQLREAGVTGGADEAVAEVSDAP